MKKSLLAVAVSVLTLVGCGTQSLRMTSPVAVFDDKGAVIGSGPKTTDARVRNYFQSSQSIDKLYAQQGDKTQALGSSGIKQDSNMGEVMGQIMLKAMEMAANAYSMGLATRGGTVTIPVGTNASTLNSFISGAPVGFIADHYQIGADGSLTICNKDNSVCIRVPPTNVSKP